jgi:hypothetical protein
MGFAEEVAKARLFQTGEDPIDAAVRQLVEQRQQQPDPASLMGIPDQVSMSEFLPFLKTVASQVNNVATLPSEALDLGMFHLLSPGGIASMAAENAMHPEESVKKFGEQLTQVLGPGLADTAAGGYTPPTAEEAMANPLMNVMMPSMLVGPKSALWKSAPQVGEVPQGVFSNLYDKTVMKEVSDAGAILNIPVDYKKALERGTSMTYAEEKPLIQILDHPELYDAYPDLSMTRTRIVIDPTREARSGEFTNQGIEVRARSAEEAKEVLLHEIQHTIQEREGWASGGSPSGMESLLRDEAIRTVPEYSDISSKLSKLSDDYKNGYLDFDEFIEQTKPLTKRGNEIFNQKYPDPHEAYLRLFGEYMARDTASRNALTEAQRMRTMRFSSEPDMTPDKMIYRYK